jgi:hypothetical protein
VSAEPQVFVGHEAGAHNNSDAVARLKKAKSHTDLSTVLVMPTRGMIPARVCEALMGLMAPMNQAFTRIFVSGMEVADAYNYAVDLILNHAVLSTWKYLLTVEEDNLPPPDGLLRLYESIGEYSAVGGLYWTKGPDGQPMQYGTEEGMLDFVPQIPVPGELNPYSDISAAALATLRSSLTMPDCPAEFLHHPETLMWYAPNPTPTQMDAVKEWTLHGAINAGMSALAALDCSLYVWVIVVSLGCRAGERASAPHWCVRCGALLAQCAR